MTSVEAAHEGVIGAPAASRRRSSVTTGYRHIWTPVSGDTGSHTARLRLIDVQVDHLDDVIDPKVRIHRDAAYEDPAGDEHPYGRCVLDRQCCPDEVLGEEVDDCWNLMDQEVRCRRTTLGSSLRRKEFIEPIEEGLADLDLPTGQSETDWFRSAERRRAVASTWRRKPSGTCSRSLTTPSLTASARSPGESSSSSAAVRTSRFLATATRYRRRAGQVGLAVPVCAN